MITETIVPSSLRRPGCGTWQGIVEHLHLCPRALLPMRSFEALELVAGAGVAGDRYMQGTGFYSHKPEPGRQVTLFEIETLEALKRDHDITVCPDEHRRNITTRGVPLNHLVGSSFRVGAAILEATRLSTPCKHLDEITGKEIFYALLNRSGLNCIIREGGTIRVGDAIEPL